MAGLDAYATVGRTEQSRAGDIFTGQWADLPFTEMCRLAGEWGYDGLEIANHVDCKDTKVRMHNGRNGRLSSHLPWADPRRGWDFISTGHGDTRWEDIFRMLNHIGYEGPISIEWEDAGMDRLAGAPEALDYIRRMNAITPPTASFDAAFATKE